MLNLQANCCPNLRIRDLAGKQYCVLKSFRIAPVNLYSKDASHGDERAFMGLNGTGDSLSLAYQIFASSVMSLHGTSRVNYILIEACSI